MGVKEGKKREEERRRQLILDVARELFLAKGYFDARMEDIAAGAELATGTLYLYFHSKDEIYATLCEEGLDVLNGLLGEAAREGGGYRERLVAMGRAYLRFYAEYGSFYDILSFVGLGFKQMGLSPALERRITRKSDAAIGLLETLVKEGVREGDIRPGESRETAFFLWGLPEGPIFIHRRGYMDACSVDLARTTAGGMDAVYEGPRK